MLALFLLMLNLNQFRDKNRVLLVFRSADAHLTQQFAEADFKERDLILIEGDDGLRRKFHVGAGAFTVVLIGKDGGEKLRRTEPIKLEELNSLIDAMPMRKSEMKRQ